MTMAEFIEEVKILELVKNESELARCLGVQTTQISRYKNGVEPLPIITHRIKFLFDMSVDSYEFRGRQMI